MTHLWFSLPPDKLEIKFPLPKAARRNTDTLLLAMSGIHFINPTHYIPFWDSIVSIATPHETRGNCTAWDASHKRDRKSASKAVTCFCQPVSSEQPGSPCLALGSPRGGQIRQGWDSSQLGNVNLASICKRNHVSLWKVRCKCGRNYMQPKLSRDGEYNYLHTDKIIFHPIIAIQF